MSMTIVPHALFKNHCECHSTFPLSSRTIVRIAIASLFCIGALAALGCLAPPVSYIVGSVLAFIAFVILSLVILALIFGEKKLPPTPRIIPDRFTHVIDQAYGLSISAFVREQQVTLAEFRQFSTALLCNISPEEKIKQLPSELRSKVESFGISRLAGDLEKNNWPIFEDLLSQTCPLYWLQKFISAGDPQVCRDLGVPRECYGYYWLGPLGYSTAKATIFCKETHHILQQLTKEDVLLLKNKALQEKWDTDEVKAIVERIYTTYTARGTLKTEAGGLTKETISKELLLLSLHGYSFDQLQLITQLPRDTWDWLCSVDNSTAYNLQLCALVGALSSQNLLDESSIDFDVNLGLYVIQDLKEAVQAFSASDEPKKELGKFLLRHLSSVSKRLESVLRQGLHRIALEHGNARARVYDVNFVTGARIHRKTSIFFKD
ncbi:conserved hypothetical protein [Chlamydia pneumoniae LPCoLN]|nr:conserved hypothetical protein [Chlamydia pneumoniae LPCoLN]ETR80231.1 hypothetical protein X556_0433 [Chlamydia pneumoniae B21]